MRDTYKYQFKIGNLVVHCGKTNDLNRREGEHKRSRRYTSYNNKRYYWREGHIVQIGMIVTADAAAQWERENRCNLNWHNE